VRTYVKTYTHGIHTRTLMCAYACVCVYVCACMCVDCINMYVCGFRKYFRKRALYFLKRALYFRIRALHIFLQCRMCQSYTKQKRIPKLRLFTHTYTHVHTHTYTHTRTHTHMCVWLWVRVVCVNAILKKQTTTTAHTE